MTNKEIAVRVDPLLNSSEGKITIITEVKLFPTDIRMWTIDDLSLEIYRVIKEKLYAEEHLRDILTTSKKLRIEALQKEMEFLKNVK
jgi:hypothetical protein